ncbi:MAG: tetratricopeptide repeat protein [Flavobacteriia bacterium]|nr:tetratricopeptide repeat protein [Flavobacteriia bacterium]
MRKKFFWSIVVITTVVSSCGIFKQKEKAEPQLTRTSFPYIEKFHEGLRLKQKGEVDGAILALNYCLGVRQDDDAVFYLLSELYLQKNDLEKSAESILKASQIDPKNTWYTQELAYMYFEQKKYPEAVKCFERLIKKEPRNVDWLYGYAESLVQNGQIEEAIKAFDKTEDQMGLIPELSMQKFRLYVQIKKAEKGIEEINKARKLYPDHPQLIAILVDYYFQTKQEAKAVSMLEEMTVADPTNGRAHMALADIYKQKGKTENYYTELFRAFACDDINIDSKMNALIEIHDRNAKLSPKDFQLAEILVAQYPDDSKSYSILGDFYLKNENQIKALESYKNALKYEQSKFPIWNQVLVMEYQNLDFENLFLDSKKCLQYFPNNITVYLFNGLSAVQLKKYSEALVSLETGKDFIVNDNSMLAEYYAQMGEANFGLLKLDEGKKNYDKALELDKNSALNMNNYAYHLANLKIDLEKAEMLIQKANEISPGQAHFIDTYGWVLFQKGNFSQAFEYYKKAFEKSTDDKIIFDHLGDGYFKAGNIEKAVEFWKKAKALGSTNKNLQIKIDKKEYYEPLY